MGRGTVEGAIQRWLESGGKGKERKGSVWESQVSYVDKRICLSF